MLHIIPIIPHTFSKWFQKGLGNFFVIKRIKAHQLGHRLLKSNVLERQKIYMRVLIPNYDQRFQREGLLND